MMLVRGNRQFEWLKRRPQYRRKPRYLTRRERIQRARHR